MGKRSQCCITYIFIGKKVPIVTQNQNGPCPLIAIINVLLLSGKITLDSTAEVVTSSQLMGYLGDIVLQTIPQVGSVHRW